MYTGNTGFYFIGVKISPVYPCVYREHITGTAIEFPSAGLSLCIQGTLVIHSHPDVVSRFIPVYTGNTQGFFDDFTKIPVYPCVYREHVITSLPFTIETGLSLCIQGTRTEEFTPILRAGFIPVYTGNTAHRFVFEAHQPVYPCVYREHLCKLTESMRFTGLSLCIQGTRGFKLFQKER